MPKLLPKKKDKVEVLVSFDREATKQSQEDCRAPFHFARNDTFISELLSPSKILSYSSNLPLVVTLVSGIVVSAVIFGAMTYKTKPAPTPSVQGLTFESKPSKEVLAATTGRKGVLTINIPAVFTDSLTLKSVNIEDQLTAKNIMYSLSATDGLSSSGGQTPTIKNTGVLSLQSKTGALTLTAGTGITLDGLKITTSAKLSDIRTNGGCSACVTDDDVASALTISGGTVNNTSIGATTTSTGAFTTLSASGATTLSSTLAVTGATTLNGAVTLGDAASDTITVTGRVGSNLVPATTGTYDLGSSDLKWSRLYLTGVATIGGQSTFTSLPTGTSVGNGVIYINPASNGGSGSNTVFGVAVDDSERLRMDADGNITIQGTMVGANGQGVGYWQRSSTTVSPATSNDIVSYSSNNTTNAFAVTATGASANAINLTADSVTTGNGLSLSVDGLTTGNGFSLTSTSTAGGVSGASYLLNLARSGTNANASHTAYGVYSAVTDTGTTSTNVAGYFTASGATNNFGLDVRSIGTSPSATISAQSSFASLIVDNTIGDLFTASSSGLAQFVITQSGKVGIGANIPTAGLHVASTGIASTPGVRIDGTWYTGGTATTTKPQLLIEPSGTTTTAWSTSGTGLGVNSASSFAGNLVDIQQASKSVFSVAGVDSAVNGFVFTPAATAGTATLAAGGAGSDTNVALTINSKATGALALDSGTTGTVSLGNGNSAKTINVGSGTGGNTINVGGTGATGADTINIGTGGTSADTITIGNNASTTSLAFTSGTGSQTHTSSVVSGATTTSGFVFTDNTTLTGTEVYIGSTGVSSGTLLNIDASATTTLTTGKLLSLTSVSNALTSGSFISSSYTPGTTTTGFTGNLNFFDYSPTATPTTGATGDILRLNLGANATNFTGNLLNIVDNSSSVFSVSKTAVTSALPFSETAPGDVSIAYDLVFTNPTASFITSQSSLALQAGESFDSSNLIFSTYNQGSIVFDSNITTGTGLDFTNTTLTTGNGMSLAFNGLTTGNGISLTSTSTAGTASTSDTLLNIARSGANAGATHTAYGIQSSITNTGTTSVNVGGLFTATGATTNRGLEIAAMTGATSTGLTIGALSGTTANTGINIGAISGASATGTGITIGNVSTTGTTNYGLLLGTMTGGTTSNYQISTGVLTSATTTTNAQLNLGGVVTTGGTTNYGINIGALSGTGTTNYGINVAASTATGTTNYGLRLGTISGAGTNNYGLYVDTVSGAGTGNYAAIFAGGYVGIGTTAPVATLDLRGTLGTTPAASISATSSFASLLVDNTIGDLFTASSSGMSRFVIANNGHVGIGQSLPRFRLDLTDSQASTVSAMFTNSNTGADGDVLALKTGATTPGAGNHFISFLDGNGIEIGKVKGNSTAVAYDTGGGDFAEYFRKGNKDEEMDTGDLLCFGLSGGVTKCNENMKGRIAGVFSSNAGFVGNNKGYDNDNNYVLVGLVGQLKVKVSSTSAVLAGDYLTVSNATGEAKVADSTGEVVGKALETSSCHSEPTSSLREASEMSDAAISSPEGIASSSTTPRNDEACTVNTLINISWYDPNYSTSMKLAAESLFSASSSSVLSDYSSSKDLNLDGNGLISGNLMVLGKTTISDLGVTGNITTGVMSIHGLTGELNTLSGDLKLQSSGIGGIDILAGKVTIDTKGNIKTVGEISAKKVNINDGDVLSASVGSATIKAGETTIDVKTNSITSKSYVFVTPRSKTNGQTLTVTKVKDKESFTVEIDNSMASDITFNWWIVN